MNDWIEWNGGECPVPGDTLVEVKFRNSNRTYKASPAKEWDWVIDHCAGDIIADRVIEPATETTKIKSDGGQTDYYKLPEHATELRHLISARGMSKSRGDIFKACYRLGEKDGSDVLYDLKKILFFAQDLIEMYERGEHI